MASVNHIEVFHIGGSTGWALGRFDADGNQIGEAEYHWRKSDAVRSAKSTEIRPIAIYDRQGSLFKLINAR